MNAPESTPILPVLSVLHTEIETACGLLLAYENAVSDTDCSLGSLKSQLQGFDLAVQILRDIQHLTVVLSQMFNDESTLPNPLPMTGLKLEHIRQKLTKDGLTGIASEKPPTLAELF